MSYNFPQEKPLLTYSDTLERASLVDYDDQEASMPPKKRKTKQKRGRKIKTNKGRITLNLKGYSGKQSFSAAQLLPFISLAKIKIAARKVLRRTNTKVRKIKRRKRKSKK